MFGFYNDVDEAIFNSNEMIVIFVCALLLNAQLAMIFLFCVDTRVPWMRPKQVRLQVFAQWFIFVLMDGLKI